MSKLLLEALDNSGLLKGRSPDANSLQRYTKTQLFELLNQAAELTNAAGLSREKSVFSQSASLSLGGGRYPCVNIGCRLPNARNLAQYAALYADKVYIYNHLAHHIARHDEPGEEEFKIDLFNDLAVIGFLRPLIEEGVICLITPPEEFCSRCFASRFAKGSIRRKNTLARRWLEEKYLTQTKVTIEQKGSSYDFCVTGPELFVDHGALFRVAKHLPRNLENMPRIMAAIRAGGPVEVSRTLRKRIVKLHVDLATHTFQDVFFEIACAQCLGTSFVTEREIHIDLLNKLSGDTELIRRNQLVERHLTAILPFLESTRVEDLLKLRQRETEAFIVFRSALTTAIQEYRSTHSGSFKEEDARQLYSDVIAPSVAKIDQTIKSAIRSTLKGSAAKVASWAAAITFGGYAGLLPGELIQVAAALGLTQILAGIAEPLLRLKFESDKIDKEEMYFLWRVRQLSR